MTDGFSSPVLGGGGALIRESAHSPNYAAGSAGWTINSDGSAEFNNVVYRGTFEGTNYIQNSAGIFQYSGTPAAGNLIGSWAAQAGSDQFGNAYLLGIATYGTPQVNGAIFQRLDPTTGAYEVGQWKGAGWDTANAAFLQVSDNDSGLGLQTAQIQFQTPQNTVLPDALQMAMAAGKTGQNTGSANTPQVAFYDSGSTSDVDMILTGTLIRGSKNGLAYSWQTPSYNTGWAGGSTASANYQALRYRFTSDNCVELYGAAHATAASPSSTVFTLPAAYRPVLLGNGGTPAIMPGGLLLKTTSADASPTAGRFNVQDTGVVVVGGFTIALSDNFYFNHKIPLGQIS